MSWILGYVGEYLSKDLRERLRRIHDSELSNWEDNACYVAVGGITETCHFDDNSESGQSWAVLGLGLMRDGSECRILDRDDWRQHVAADSLPDKLDGHHVAVKWSSNHVEACTDALGLRTLYFAETEVGLAFSTRLDWMARLLDKVDLDLEAFGGHWLLFNQMTTASLIRGIRRLGPGGRLTWIRGGSVVAKQQPWSPLIEPVDRDGTSFAEILTSFLNPHLRAGGGTSLGLSGGLDSRLLLALSPARQRTHVFGAEHHPDVRVARSICDEQSVSQLHFHEDIPGSDRCINLLTDHVAHTQVVSPASSVVGLRYYHNLRARRLLMIDGGLGEITRRQYLNRVYRRGQRSLTDRDARVLFPLLSSPRVEVFSEDIVRRMREGAEQQIFDLCQALPDAAAVGVGNVLDIIGVRTRLPNFFGFEQNRLDAIVQNYMPFAQPTVLSAVFRLPLSLRRNARLARRLIAERRPALVRYPLVKGGTTYPYILAAVPSYLWVKGKSLAGRAYNDRIRIGFLDRLRSYALDTVHSNSVRSCALYDVEVLKNIVQGFYGGRTELASQVDWWLAFEVWRQTVRFGRDRLE